MSRPGIWGGLAVAASTQHMYMYGRTNLADTKQLQHDNNLRMHQKIQVAKEHNKSRHRHENAGNTNSIYSLLT